jgi:hypothetical protein
VNFTAVEEKRDEIQIYHKMREQGISIIIKPVIQDIKPAETLVLTLRVLTLFARYSYRRKVRLWRKFDQGAVLEVLSACLSSTGFARYADEGLSPHETVWTKGTPAGRPSSSSKCPITGASSLTSSRGGDAEEVARFRAEPLIFKLATGILAKIATDKELTARARSIVTLASLLDTALTTARLATFASIFAEDCLAILHHAASLLRQSVGFLPSTNDKYV